jgi:hypothetical protein
MIKNQPNTISGEPIWPSIHYLASNDYYALIRLCRIIIANNEMVA